MSLAELLPAIRALPKAEKAELLHLLVDDVTHDDRHADAALATFFPPGATFEVATPPDGFEAAAVLQQLLDAEKGRT